jgi:dihydroorotate dehydrogenase electron transfer subunit
MTHFADCAQYHRLRLLRNDEVARNTRVLRVQANDAVLNVIPGQFFMLRLDPSNDPLIGRAFALWDYRREENWMEIIYLVKGKFTSKLAELRPGDSIAYWGPLGNGFSTEPVDRLIMVAGGIGQTPFWALAREALGLMRFGNNRAAGYAKQVDLCYGARTADYLAGVSSFEESEVHVKIATEDGSKGFKGRVTDLLSSILDQPGDESRRIVCCGPEPMMEAVAKICHSRNVSCEVSLETPMACGIGICFSCVAKVGTEHDWDYKRTCVDGPIFDASQIVW